MNSNDKDYEILNIRDIIKISYNKLNQKAHKKEIVAYMNEYKYLNLKNKSILEFKVDDSSIEKEIYLNEENIDEKNLKEIPIKL